MRTRLATLNVDPIGSTPDELGRFLRSEYAKWNKVIKSVELQPQ